MSLFEKEKRRYIEPDKYFEISCLQREKSLCNKGDLNFELIQDRISELDLLERKLGFVYIAEKRWLECLLEQQKLNIKYSVWLNDYIKPYFKFVYGEFDKRVCWQALAYIRIYLINFKELENPAFYAVYKPLIEMIDYSIDVNVIGSKYAPSIEHLVAMYEVLHDLQYYVHMLSHDTHGYEASSVEEINMLDENDPNSWYLTPISEYGNAWDIQFKDRALRKYKVAIDVLYHEDNSALAVGILFKEWNSKDLDFSRTKKIDKVAPYVSGQFNKRELPCILELLNEFSIDEIECIVVDGFVWLGDPEVPGLGKYLYESLNKKIPIIGVAKNKHLSSPTYCEIYRGRSKNPLYVTAIGIDLETAKESILNMNGDNRIPSLLKKVDKISRGNFS